MLGCPICDVTLLGLFDLVVGPAGRSVLRHDVDECLDRVDLSPVDLKCLECRQSVSGSVAIRVSEIETKQHEAHFLIHRCEPITDGGMCDHALRADVLAAGAGAGAGGKDSILEAVGIRSEWRMDRIEIAAHFQAGRIELGNPDQLRARHLL